MIRQRSCSRLESFLESCAGRLPSFPSLKIQFRDVFMLQSVVIGAIYAHNQIIQQILRENMKPVEHIDELSCSLCTILRSLIYSKFNKFTQRAVHTEKCKFALVIKFY
jgi:hypothetical protein